MIITWDLNETGLNFGNYIGIKIERKIGIETCGRDHKSNIVYKNNWYLETTYKVYLAVN